MFYAQAPKDDEYETYESLFDDRSYIKWQNVIYINPLDHMVLPSSITSSFFTKDACKKNLRNFEFNLDQNLTIACKKIS